MVSNKDYQLNSGVTWPKFGNLESQQPKQITAKMPDALAQGLSWFETNDHKEILGHQTHTTHTGHHLVNLKTKWQNPTNGRLDHHQRSTGYRQT